MHRGVCRACNEHVVPVVPSRLWKVAVPAGYVALVMVSLLLMLLGPHMALSAPIWMFGFMGLMAPIHARAAREPECPSCGRIFEEKGAAEPAPVRVAQARAA